MTSRRRTKRVLSLLLISAVTLPSLAGCALLPPDVKAWLRGTLEDGNGAGAQEDYFVYDYPVNTAPQPEPQPQKQWSEQSWIDGAPVTTPPPPAVEKAREPYLRAVPLGYERAVFKGDPEARISKLELEVSSLRQQVEAMLPALRALVDARGGQIPGAASTAEQPAPVYTNPPPQSGMQPQALTPWSQPQGAAAAAALAPQAPAYASYAENIRFGEHANKTRIVVDLASPTAYTYELSNEQGYLAIVLPEAGWRGPVRGTLNNSPLFSGYTVQQIPGKGSRLVLQLRKPVRVLFADHLDPNNTYRSHRIFLDVAGQ